jgi:glycosyl transferase family 5 (putative starch synthase catalytic subunit)
MRVLMLSPEYPPIVVGGIATHTMHLVAALAAEGDCEVTLLTSRGARDMPAEQREDVYRRACVR